MTLTNSSSIVVASTQSWWAGVSAWLSISDCRMSSKFTWKKQNKRNIIWMMKMMIFKTDLQNEKIPTFSSAVWLALFPSSRAARASYTLGRWEYLTRSPCRTTKPGHVVLGHSYDQEWARRLSGGKVRSKLWWNLTYDKQLSNVITDFSIEFVVHAHNNKQKTSPYTADGGNLFDFSLCFRLLSCFFKYIFQWNMSFRYQSTPVICFNNDINHCMDYVCKII